MLSAARQAFAELFSPPFRAVMLKSVGFTLALLVGLIVAVQWSFSYFVAWPDWIETAVQVLGGLALVAASIFLIPPVTSLIAGLYLDNIAGVVEREAFPSDPPGQDLPAARSIGFAIRFFFIVLAVNLLALLLLLVPGVNLVAFYVGNGYLLGREYFELAAMRHVNAAEAKRIRKQHSKTVFLCGLIIAAVASVPILNLVTPLFATGFMVRMWKRIAAKSQASLAGPGGSLAVRNPVPQSTRV
ncbi:MAG: sulfate transporter family protein [Pseudomonadota bacterium]